MVRLMKPIRGSLIAWEMVLLFASIFVFRSVWTLLDRWAWAGQTPGLLTLLAVGSAVSVVAFRAINKS
jgi:hypothetical protein